MKKIRTNPKKPAVSQQTLRFKLSIVSITLALLFFGHYPFLSVANTQEEALDIANHLKTQIRETGKTVSEVIEKIQEIEWENKKLQTEIDYRQDNQRAKRTKFKKFTGASSFNEDISSIRNTVLQLGNKLTQLKQDILKAERNNSALHVALSQLNYRRETYDESLEREEEERRQQGERKLEKI